MESNFNWLQDPQEAFDSGNVKVIIKQSESEINI